MVKIISKNYWIWFIFILWIGCEKNEDVDIRRKHFVDKTTLRFDLLTSKEKLTIINLTDFSQEATVHLDTFYFELGFYYYSNNQNKFEIHPGESYDLPIKVKRENIMQDSISSSIILEYSGSSYSDTVNVIAKGYCSNFVWLNKNVTDIEYNEIYNSILYVSDYPKNSLNVYNFEHEEQFSINLDKSPKCISISPNGKFCAIGYDKAAEYFDLSNLNKLKNIDVSCLTRDIVLDDNGNAFLFPREINSENIHSVNFITSKDSVDESSYYQYNFCKAILSKDQQSIYAVEIDDLESNTSSFPKDLLKYDISTGIIELTYDSKYHGDYKLSKVLQIIENGDLLLSVSVLASTLTIDFRVL